MSNQEKYYLFRDVCAKIEVVNPKALLDVACALGFKISRIAYPFLIFYGELGKIFGTLPQVIAKWTCPDANAILDIKGPPFLMLLGIKRSIQ